jgi:hypothetical protein
MLRPVLATNIRIVLATNIRFVLVQDLSRYRFSVGAGRSIRIVIFWLCFINFRPNASPLQENREVIIRRVRQN